MVYGTRKSSVNVCISLRCDDVRIKNSKEVQQWNEVFLKDNMNRVFGKPAGIAGGWLGEGGMSSLPEQVDRYVTHKHPLRDGPTLLFMCCSCFMNARLLWTICTARTFLVAPRDQPYGPLPWNVVRARCAHCGQPLKYGSTYRQGPLLFTTDDRHPPISPNASSTIHFSRTGRDNFQISTQVTFQHRHSSISTYLITNSIFHYYNEPKTLQSKQSRVWFKVLPHRGTNTNYLRHRFPWSPLQVQTLLPLRPGI